MSLEKKVRKTIKKELQTVNSSNAPRVFEAIQTDLGYKNIEDRVINMMIDNNSSASAAIGLIEMTL